MREIQSVFKLPRKHSVCVVSGLQRKKQHCLEKNSLSENCTNLANRPAETKRQFKFPPGPMTGVCKVLTQRSLKQTRHKSLKASIYNGFSSTPELQFCSCSINNEFRGKKGTYTHTQNYLNLRFKKRKYLIYITGSWISNVNFKEANPKILLCFSQLSPSPHPTI